MTDGVLLAKPILLDRLTLHQVDAVFHIGIGTALTVAAFVPGDGSLRWLEGLLGLGMLMPGLKKAREFAEQKSNAIGIGLAYILSGMTPQQLAIAKAAVKVLGLTTNDVEAPKLTGPSPEVKPTIKTPE